MAALSKMSDHLQQLQQAIEAADDKLAAIETARELLHSLCPLSSQPVDRIRWVPIDMVEPNDYNPNSVAISNEM